MIRSGRLNESVSRRMVRPENLDEEDIFQDDGEYYRVIKVSEKRGPDYHVEVKCIDREDKELTINFDFSDGDKVRMMNPSEFSWTFSFLAIDRSDNYDRREIKVKAFTRSEARESFEAITKKQYRGYKIRDVRVIPDEI